MSFIIFSSYGNDSVALIQWVINARLEDVTVAYSDTGWAAKDWEETRVVPGEKWCKANDIKTVRIISEGMKDLVRRKKMFPHGGGGRFQFCTQELKIKPALEWMDKNDTDREAICLVGIRREESENRANFPAFIMSSEGHGGRKLWAPLIFHNEAERNALIKFTPFDVLPHRSKECDPCVNRGKKELKHLSDERVAEIEEFEQEMGINSKGNQRTLYSPRRHNGAIGIRSVVEDARKNMDDMFSEGCDSGWCGG